MIKLKPKKSLAVVQSNYIPWKGYFDLINMVDEFILFDVVQYTRRDWRNRNLIKTPQGLQWLTIPVDVKGKYLQKICETRVSDPNWAIKHWTNIAHNYGKAKHFRENREIFESLYLGSTEEYLSQINHKFIREICNLLKIKTRITSATDYPSVEGKSERLIALCKAVGANHYVSGPAAKAYMDEPLLAAEGIHLSYIDYSGYPEYFQLHGEFEHGVSVLDLIFNEGAAAPSFMKSFGQQQSVVAAAVISNGEIYL
jgi:hypothetical protein